MTGHRRYCIDTRTVTAHFPGVGRYSSELAGALQGSLDPGEELALLCPTAADSPVEGLREGATRFTTPVSPFSLWQQFTIPRLLKQRRVDLYHSTYYLMPYRPGVPTVLTVYDLIPIRYPASVSRGGVLLFRLFHHLAVSAATGIIAISAATRDDLLAHYRIPPGKVRLIRLGVSPRFKPASTAQIDSVRERYSLPVGYVLYVGINKPHKNLPALVRAWARLKESLVKPPPLVICGPWDSRYPEARLLVARLGLEGFVRLVGPVALDDLPALYSAARLFVFPSLYEGFGLPVLEALACGTPVACSHIRALREVAGEAAAFFDPRNPEAVAKVVASLIDDTERRRNLSEAGLLRAHEFTWTTAAQKTLALYRELA